ncbi:hypothetical protein F5884DRAFT_438694 [Xylogone sp. PMI_703]|nr:hypothetical protein F5884DRAFT_438694 [Xylogone sp. PMI_703]
MDFTTHPTGIWDLPNEVLMNTLSTFPTRALLPFTTVSHRFHDIILRIIQNRLNQATTLKDHKLILECYHPSTKLTTPYLFCDYLGTDVVSDDVHGNGTGPLGKLSDLYSHFRPLPAEDTRPTRRWHPAGAVPQPPEPLTPSTSDDEGELEDEEPLASHNVNLESFELFSQLCTVTSLIKVGPKRGLFLSCVNISEGVMRVWRQWLAEQAESYRRSRRLPQKSKSRATFGEVREYDSTNILWADANKTVGLRLRVKQRNDTSLPVLMHRDEEDEPVSYTLEYEELVIRTTQLLLMVEESINQEIAHSGKAIVIGSFG